MQTLLAETEIVQVRNTIEGMSNDARQSLYTMLLTSYLCRALNCFSPNINLIRDPRWGRASETYGEDPHLTSELVKAYVAGLQGNDSHYVKVVLLHDQLQDLQLRPRQYDFPVSESIQCCSDQPITRDVSQHLWTAAQCEESFV